MALEQPDQNNIDFTLFLTGGVALDDPSGMLNAIDEQPAAKKRGLVLLGDVLTGDQFDMEENNPVFERLQALDKQYHAFYAVPGEKEWGAGKKTSFSAISILDKAIKDVKEKGRILQPGKGCGEPEVIEISNKTILVLLDSQWAIETEARNGLEFPGCEFSGVLDLRMAMKDIIQSYAGYHIIFAAHHPVYANGPVAGNYPLSAHLLPVPVVGTLITGVRSLVSSNQHFGHPAYEAYRNAITSALDRCKSCIYISGHEKSLQAYQKEGKHFIVAGSGSEVEHARKGEDALFSYMSKGFARVDELNSGELLVSLYAVKNNGTQKVWSVHIPEVIEEKDERVSNADTDADSILMQASDRYENKKFLRGEFYRKAWSTPIQMPVLKIEEVHGGLKPVQLGGGNQTRSLRLENVAGEQYVLRSIDKKVTTVLPAALRGTFAENIVQDGIAASHPYGALVVPRLAHAAGVYYTNPAIVYVPYQSALGIYNDDIGNGVYLFEERPGGTTERFDNFGNTQETYNTFDVMDIIEESPHHIIDQKATLKARLFDVWLGDWDRHDDQWRWASFEENGITVYRPIPRDRDQVFFKNDGALDYLASRPYFNPPLRKFDEEIDYLPGLIWAGKYFDRTFLNALTEEDFIAAAQDLQSVLTNNVIDEAFLDWPPEIDAIDGSEIRRALRQRRDDLVSYAKEFHRHISKEVNVPATADQDIIHIRAIDDKKIHITVDRMSKGETFRFYQRTIDEDVTRELRVYGLSKKDSIYLEGEMAPSVRIRIVGGSGEDYVINHSAMKPIVYDDDDGLLASGRKMRLLLNNKPFNNAYDRTDWKLNKLLHFPLPAFYTDEGLGITYNLWATRYGFRKDPYASNHIARLSYFFNTSAFIGKYQGVWPETFGDLDFGLDLFFTGPTFTQYYYGLGNTYVDFGESPNYHIVKGSRINLKPVIGKSIGFGSRIYAGPEYQYFNLQDQHDEPRFVYTEASNLSPDDFGEKHYIGITAGYNYERFDNSSFPSRGGSVGISISGKGAVKGDTRNHSLFSAAGSLYIPFSAQATVVLATHVQADKIVGEYAFFHALTLGGPDKLRGYKTDRFAGDGRIVHASDLRIRLFRSRGIIPMTFGVYGSFDYGRIWLEGNENTDDTWHSAWGGGVYIVPLGLTGFRLGYMAGGNDMQWNIGGSLKF